MLDRSGVAELLSGWMPKGGRHGQLDAKAVLLGMLMAIDAGRPAHLRAGREALFTLDVSDQVRLGALASSAEADGLRTASYRQFSHTHQVMVGAIDPTPVPSFRGVYEEDRASQLAEARAGVDHEAMAERLALVLDALVEASVPEGYKKASSSLAVDWTDYETWSRPRAKDDPQPANDPTASWGHCKRNAPGAVDHLFFGFYPQVATMVVDERGPAVPELVRQIAFAPPRTDPARAMAEALVRRAERGHGLGDVLEDSGYSNRDPEAVALPLRRHGARLVMDLHPDDRGQKGTHEGAICCNGNLYCPQTPKALFELAALKKDPSQEEIALHDERCAELARYKFGRISGDDQDGTHRRMCPALLGKLRCPVRHQSMALHYSHPEVLSPPEHPPTCCTQQTISVPEDVLAKTAQKHDYPSKAWRLSYNRRTGSERTFAWLQDPATIGMRRGWCRMFGLTKNALAFTLGVVVRNVRIVVSYEARVAEEARRASMGLGPVKRRRRRRRHRAEGAGPEAPAPVDAPNEPG